MAIYHFSVNIISRSAGRSATAAAAYRAAEKIRDNRTGEIHDYTNKKGVDEKFILAPFSAPSWVYNRSSLWNKVEEVERRKDSQLAREINVAIPTELDKTQQIKLVKEFVRKEFVKEGMVADVAFHNLESHNPHAHIMLTMREIEKDGFKKKNREWNKRELLEKKREAWAAETNKVLELAGIESKIDHRSYEAQGINRIPQIHLGSAVTAMTKRGVETDKGERWKAIAEANKQIETLERSLSLVSSEINTLEKVITSSSQGQASEVKVSGISSSVSLNFDQEETSLDLPQVPSFSGRNSRQPESGAVDRTRNEYKNTLKLIHQELGQNVSEPRLDFEVYLRTNSRSEILKQSEVYQRLEKDNPKIAKYYVMAIALAAPTYKSLSDRKTPDLDKWAKNLINSQLSKFYAQANNQSQNIEQQKTRRRGLSL